MKKVLGVLTLAAVAAVPTARADFGLGDLAVLRVGDGTQTLGNTGNSIFIDDYSKVGSLMQSFAITDSGSSSLIASGTATSEGALSLTPDGSTLVFAGYNTTRPASSSLTSSASTTIPRGVGTVSASGIYTFQGNTTTQFSANNVRSATGDGSGNYWMAGANSGTYYLGFSAAAATVQSSSANTRVLSIQNNNLYFSTGSGTRGVYGFTGTPTAAAAPTLIIGTGGSSSPYAFAFNAAGTIAYIADDDNFTTSTGVGGIERWDKSGGTWSLTYTLKPEASGTAGARSLVADFSGADPVLYFTTAETSGNHVGTIVDTGSGSTATDLADTAANEAFRGIEFAPQSVPEPTTMTLLGLGGAAMAYSFRRRKK